MKGLKNKISPQLRPNDTAPSPASVKAELVRLREAISKKIEENPAKAAHLLTDWLNSNSHKKAG